MLAGWILVLPLCVDGAALEASARWRCEPAAVEVGQPFELVLELVHARGTSAGGLLHGEPAVDDTWVVFERRPARTLERGDGALTSLIVWSVASLEPGERDLSAALSAVALGEQVKSIQVGDARVEVRTVLAAGEDAPRPLREFPERFGTPGDPPAGRPGRLLGLAGALAALLALGVVLLVRRRRSARPRAAPTPLELLGELERRSEPQGSWAEVAQRSRDGCYELTRLLRGAADGVRSKDRSGLTDEEWLAELRASLDVPAVALDELGAVLERAERVKYAGQPATTWALQETFARARSALQALGAGAVPDGAAR